MAESSTPLSNEINAAFAWWSAAGVDHDYHSDATAWLTDAPPPEADRGNENKAGGQKHSDPTVTEHAATIKDIAALARELMGDSPPDTLDAFREFWLTAPGLDAIGPRGRVPPRGDANPDLMIIVTDPEQGDGAQLLSGTQGRLLDNIIAAIGVASNAVYIASALPRHTPMADTAAAADAGMGAILAHHVNLVAPKRIIAFGGNLLPLLQHGVTKDETHLREINQKGSSQQLLVSEGLDSLLAMPRLKGRFWRRWNEWSSKS